MLVTTFVRKYSGKVVGKEVIYQGRRWRVDARTELTLTLKRIDTSKDREEIEIVQGTDSIEEAPA